MALRETHIDVDFTADANPLRHINQEINNVIRQIKVVGDSFGQMADESQRMLNEMRTEWDQQRKALLVYRNDMAATEDGYLDLAKGSKEYTDGMDDLLKSLRMIAAAEKKMQDEALKHNEGTNPLREINKEINGVVRHTREARKSYEGLTDSSKEMLRQMSYGWRNQSDAFYKFKNDLIAAEYEYHNLARGTAFFGDATDDLLKAIDQVGKAHKKATDGMLINNEAARRSIYQTIGTMANMTPLAEKNSAALARMNNPLYNANRAGLAVVGTLNRIANNANTARVALDTLGPTANMKELTEEIQRLNRGLGAMPIVAIGAGIGAFFFYRAMHRMAMGNKEYAESFKTMKETLRKAIQPMVDVFAMIMIPVYKFITAIGQMIIRFNEAHPVLAKMIQGVLLLIPALTLLLLPLGLGVGYIKGMALAFGYLFRMIAPAVTFLATMSATVWIVAIAIVALVAGINYLWKTNEGFRNAVISAWNAIKAAAVSVWQGLIAVITPAFQAIVAFVKLKLDEIKAFWSANGQQIIMALQNAWAIIKSIFSASMAVIIPILGVAWMIIKNVIISTWNAIKSIINGALNIIQGIITVFSGIFTGNFRMVWEGVKQIFQGALQVLWGWINLYFIGKFLAPLRGFASQGRALIVGAWNLIKGIFTGSLNAIRSVVTGSFNAVNRTISSVMNAIKSIIVSIWNSIRSTINTVTSTIKSIVTNVFNSLKTTVSTAMNNVKTAIVNGWNAAKSFLQSIDLSSIGKNIIQGLINGIGSMMGAVAEKIKGVASTVTNGIKKALDINSPSRVMMELGGFTAQGFSIGMEEEQKHLRQISYEMSNTPTEYTPESSSTTNTNRSNNSIVFNPTIQLSGNNESGENVKQKVKEALDEAFDYLLTLYDPEADY